MIKCTKTHRCIGKAFKFYEIITLLMYKKYNKSRLSSLSGYRITLEVIANNVNR